MLKLVGIFLLIVPTFSLTETNSIELPIGSVTLFAGIDIPLGWLPCNGSAVSRLTYAPLFQVIGNLYGDGDNVHTFNLPDFRGRFALGHSNMGVHRLAIRPSGASTVTLSEKHLPIHTHGAGNLSTVSAGTHSHGYHDPGHDHGGHTGEGPLTRHTFSMHPGPGFAWDGGSHTHPISRDWTKITIQEAGNHTHTIVGDTATKGGGQAFSIMPPHLGINYIIYAGPKV